MLPVLLELFSIARMRRRLIFLALVTFVTMPMVGHAAAQQTDKQRQLGQAIEETNKETQQARAAALDFQSRARQVRRRAG